MERYLKRMFIIIMFKLKVLRERMEDIFAQNELCWSYSSFIEINTTLFLDLQECLL